MADTKISGFWVVLSIAGVVLSIAAICFLALGLSIWDSTDARLDISPQSVGAQFAKSAPVYRRFARALDENGDGTGNKIATGDYSATPASFRICPALNEVYRITGFHVFYQDTPGWKAEEYGSAPPLSVGVKLSVTTAGDTVQGMDFSDGITFKSNGDWARIFTAVEFVEMGGGDEFAAMHWLIEETGHELQLTGASQHCLTVLLKDDFSFLLSQVFTAEGYVVGQTY